MKIIYICKSVITFLLISFSLLAFGDDIPDRPVPPRMVNDYANFLNQSEIQSLESKLVQFNNETSTQIVVVVVPDLLGYEVNDFANRLGEKWGVGQKGKDNGIVILVKPKTAVEQGRISIQTGYGIEEFVPDIVAKRIIENEIIPGFKEGNYYEGLMTGINILISLTKNEFTSDEYIKRAGTEKLATVLFPVIFFIIVFIFAFARSRKSSYYTPGKKLPFWIALMMLGGSSGRGGGSFGNFSSGGGGFGGFGGGSFGGGGAGGSW